MGVCFRKDISLHVSGRSRWFPYRGNRFASEQLTKRSLLFSSHTIVVFHIEKSSLSLNP